MKNTGYSPEQSKQKHVHPSRVRAVVLVVSEYTFYSVTVRDVVIWLVLAHGDSSGCALAVW